MNTSPISDRHALIEHLQAGCKPKEQWRIGTEHEKFGFRLDDLRPLPYEGETSIRAMLEGLSRFGWEPVRENGKLIALKGQQHDSITLEPGGQLELSGAPLEHIHQTCAEVHTHLKQVKSVAEQIGAGFLGMGFQPKWPRDDIPWMPKARYRIMRQYMPKVGELGLDMMLRTCTVQVNLDFSSEADMVRKFRVSLALQPLATALFANSPFTEGRPNGYLSWRSHIWTRTDPQRAGMLPFVFEEGMGFERWVDYLLDVPMYFVYRDGQYLDASGQSFRDFLAGKLPALPGEQPTLQDFEDHMTTCFPEVRLKRYLEMRGADGGPWHRLCALPAFWTGLLYDQQALDAAWDLVRSWSTEQRQQLREDVPRLGLNARIGDRSLQDVAMDVLAMAENGLKNRARHNGNGRDERIYLDSLWRIAEQGITPAERKLRAFHNEWDENIDFLFSECVY